MQKFVVFLLCGFCLAFFAPDITNAGGLVPCGGTDQVACQTCDVVKLVNNVVEWLIIVLGTLAAIIIVYAGIKLVTSGGNQAAMESAKSMITNVIIGYVIILAAWLVIDYGMKALVVEDATFGVWNEVQCTTQVTPGLSDPITIDYDEEIKGIDVLIGGGGSDYLGWIGGGGGGGGGGSVPGAGGCTVQTNPANACFPGRLACFGGTDVASRICSQESYGGRTDARSSTDICQDGNSFSMGLWQINLIVHYAKIPGCSQHFRTYGEGLQGSCIRWASGRRYCAVRNCEVTNVSMYNYCSQQVMRPEINTQIACGLYRARGNWGDWAYSARLCGGL